MVEHIKRGVNPIIPFLEKHKGHTFKLGLENHMIDISEKAIINYKQGYLYIDETDYECIIKLDSIKSITVWK